MTEEGLDQLMEFGHTIHVHEDGTVTEDGPRANEMLLVCLDSDGGAPDPDQADIDLSLGAGWSLLTGWTGQYGYRGPIMHASEYIGGGLARYILETPGYYCSVIVDGIPEDAGEDVETESVGWAIAYRPATE